MTAAAVGRRWRRLRRPAVTPGERSGRQPPDIVTKDLIPSARRTLNSPGGFHSHSAECVSIKMIVMTSDEPLSDEPPSSLRLSVRGAGGMTGSLAHEIKNPLSVIRMNMELLAEDFADPETPRERRALAKIDMVTRQCTRLENLLNDFLGSTKSASSIFAAAA